jgi:anti-anti-sigma factor
MQLSSKVKKTDDLLLDAVRFAGDQQIRCGYLGHIIHKVLMLPKYFLPRLTGKMKSMNETSNCALYEDPGVRDPQGRGDETGEYGLRLRLQARDNDCGATIVLCKGRIVYRDEAATLSRTLSTLLREGRNLVLDLSGVEAVDGAGLGEFVGLHNRAAAHRGSIKLAALRNHVRGLFDLTNLAPVFEIYPTVESALSSLENSAVI